MVGVSDVSMADNVPGGGGDVYLVPSLAGCMGMGPFDTTYQLIRRQDDECSYHRDKEKSSITTLYIFFPFLRSLVADCLGLVLELHISTATPPAVIYALKRALYGV